MHSSAITPVFYNNKFGIGVSGCPDLCINKIGVEIDWGEATELIKFEGFYMFGGKLKNMDATNQMLIFQVRWDTKTKQTLFKIIKPRTIGKQPAPRYQHSITFMKKCDLVCLYGGRNDLIPKN